MRNIVGHLCLFILLLHTTIAFTENSLTPPDRQKQGEMNETYPYIVEYIPEFKLSDKDIPNLLGNQFKSIVIQNVKTAYVSLEMHSISTVYSGSKKKSQFLSPLKVKVTQDSFSMSFQFTAKVLHTLGSKTYNCQTKLPQIFFSYTKEVDFQSGKTLLQDYETSFQSSLFTIPTCKQAQSKKDQARLDESINSTEGSSIYTEIKKIFAKIPDFLNSNFKGQHLSKIYDTNPYVYNYYGYVMKVDVGTLNAQPLGQQGVQNQIKGVVGSSLIAAVPPPTYVPDYTSFYSLQFIRNMIAQSKESNPTWQNIKLNGANMRTRIFKWKLIDFEYLMPTILKKYPALYMNNVTITCSILELGTSKLTQDAFFQNIRWSCEGSLQTAPATTQVFLNFVPQLQYKVSIRTDVNILRVLVNEVTLKSLQFNYIDQHEVVDAFMAAEMIKQGLFEFRVYTIGSFFKILSNHNELKLTEVGIWIR